MLGTSIVIVLPMLWAGTDESGLLERVRTAQQANVGGYESGRLRAVLRMGQTAPKSSHGHHECEVEWLGEKVRADVWSQTGEERRDFVFQRDLAPMRRWVRSDRSLMTYHPDGQVVSVVPPERTELPIEARLTPECWCGPFGSDRITWLMLLDACIKAQAGGQDTRVVVRQPSPETVEVVATAQASKHTSRMLFSLAMEGNLIEYDRDDGERGASERARYTWARDQGGRDYLKTMDQQEAFTRRGQVIQSYTKFEVLEFDPDYRVSPGRFTLAGLGLKPGTYVDDQVTGRRYQHGKAPVPAVADQLDGLIRQMRAKGFAEDGPR